MGLPCNYQAGWLLGSLWRGRFAASTAEKVLPAPAVQSVTGLRSDLAVWLTITRVNNLRAAAVAIYVGGSFFPSAFPGSESAHRFIYDPL